MNLLFTAIFLFLTTFSVFANEKTFNVLILSSFHETLPWSENYRRGIIETFNETGGRLQPYFEYMDSFSGGEDITQEKRALVLAEKYAGVRFDAVLADSDVASLFLTESGRELFGDIPFVLYSTAEPLEDANLLSLAPNIRNAVKRTLEMGFSQNPDADTVYLVTSEYSSSRRGEQYIRELMTGYPNKKLVVFDDYAFDELYKKVAELPKDGFLIYQIVYHDKKNSLKMPKTVLDEVVRLSPVPVYGYYSSFLSSGLVGGQMIDASIISKEMLKAAMKMAAGEKVHPRDLRTTRRYVDWKSVEKFGLKFNSDEPNTVVLNKPVSLFTQYKKEMSAIITVMCILILLVVVLIVLTIRLKRANDSLLLQKSIIVNQSKMAGMGQMLEAIGHQWKQPLNTLSLFHSMIEESDLLKKADDPLLAKTHQEVIRSIRNMGDTIDDFTNFFDPERIRAEFKIQKIFDDTILLVGKVLRRTEIKLEGDGNISLVSYEKELKQVIISIILNSRDAFEERKIHNGRIEVVVSEDISNNLVRILIKDNAGGIAEDILPKIFEPFFSTKGAKGTGFGLYLVRLILADSLNGKISAYNNEKGVTFDIEIPKS